MRNRAGYTKPAPRNYQNSRSPKSVARGAHRTPGSSQSRRAVATPRRNSFACPENSGQRWPRPLFVTVEDRNGDRGTLFFSVTAILPDIICHQEGIRRMRIIGIGLAAAMLAGGMGIAIAQMPTTTTTSPSSTTTSTSAGKSWDAVTKQVRTETPGTSSGSSTMSGSSASSIATGSTSTSSLTKPPDAAGLPDCKH